MYGMLLPLTKEADNYNWSLAHLRASCFYFACEDKLRKARLEVLLFRHRVNVKFLWWALLLRS